MPELAEAGVDARALAKLLHSAGNWDWDSFAAECGVALMTETPTDSMARELVIVGLTSIRYATVSEEELRSYRDA